MNPFHYCFYCFRYCCQKKDRKKRNDELLQAQNIIPEDLAMRYTTSNGTTGVSPKNLYSSKQAENILDDREDVPCDIENVPESHLGRIKYRLQHDPLSKTLSVFVLEAEDLPAMDVGGQSDPYVKIFLQPLRDECSKTYETRVVLKTLSPVFEECFIFTDLPYSELMKRTLVLAVYDFDRFSKHDPIGQALIPLYQVDFARPMDTWKPLQSMDGSNTENKLGDLCFSLRYVPTSGKLTVIVLEAKNLKKMDINGLSDPFVKIYLLYKGKRLKKKKTTIKRRTLNPYYNESFTFDVPLKHIPETSLVFTVIDYDRLSKSDPIGRVVVGSKVGGLELKHWEDMIKSPRRLTGQWHILRDPDDKRDDN